MNVKTLIWLLVTLFSLSLCYIFGGMAIAHMHDPLINGINIFKVLVAATGWFGTMGIYAGYKAVTSDRK